MSPSCFQSPSLLVMFSMYLRGIGVSIAPGQIAFTRILYGARSTAIQRVRLTSPPFAAPYAAIAGYPTMPPTEEMLMIEPLCSKTICVGFLRDISLQEDCGFALRSQPCGHPLAFGEDVTEQ